jgi:hypothetical protein
MFSQSTHTNASRSVFSSAGHDQHNYHYHTTVLNITVSGLTTEQTQDVLCKKNWKQLSPSDCPEISPPEQSLILSDSESFHDVYASGVAVDLITEILRLLADSVESSGSVQYRELKLVLDSLLQTLVFTRLAIQVYECTPLGPRLRNNIDPTAKTCCSVLQDIVDKINRRRKGLKSTPISSIWGLVWWSGAADEMSPMIPKLSACQESLGMFLVALNSYVYMLISEHHRSLRLSLFTLNLKELNGKILETDYAQEVYLSKISIAI